MRVAMLTVNVYDNYGNTLQKYALYRTLEKFADEVEVLWHHGTKQFSPYNLELSPNFVGNVRASAFQCVRENKFKEFDDSRMRTRFDLPCLEDVADEYDFFVVGSDQVWNPDLCVPGNFLEFAPPEKRIAYAASIAVPELPANLVDYYREKISEMAYVSIREAEGVDLVEKITGKRPLRVLDPVFLLDAEEWRAIAKPPLWLKKKLYANGYLLSYFFNGNPPEQVRALAEKLGLPIVNLLDLNNFDHYATGIEEFLYLVDHATLMCTQSFHGTAFALNFKTPVVVYKVQIGRMMQRFSRLVSLLDLFGLSDRATDVDLELKMKDPLEIDFTKRDEVILAERAKALTFLEVALGLNPPEELPQEQLPLVEVPQEELSADAGIAEEADADDEVVAAEAAVDEAVVDEAAVDEATVDEATVDEAAVDEAAVDEAAVDESAVDEAAVDESAVDEATVDESAVDEAAVDETAVVDDAAVDESAVDEAAVDEAAVDEAVVDEATVDEAVVDEATVDESAVDEAAVDESAVDEATVDEAAVDEAAVDEAETAADESEASEFTIDSTAQVEIVLDDPTDPTLEDTSEEKRDEN